MHLQKLLGSDFIRGMRFATIINILFISTVINKTAKNDTFCVERMLDLFVGFELLASFPLLEMNYPRCRLQIL